MSEFALQVFAIAIGLAILVTLLVITFKLGTWANRISTLERILGPYILKVDTIDKNLAILLERFPVGQHLEVNVKKADDGKSVQ